MQQILTVYDRHFAQKEKILAIFRAKSFIYTKELVRLGIYQYNARIKELRNEGFSIVSCKLNGQFGFVLEKNLVSDV